MPSDPDLLLEQLAQEFGCSNGTCDHSAVYDYDAHCYWWLQEKVEQALEMETEEVEESPDSRIDPFAEGGISDEYEIEFIGGRLARQVMTLNREPQEIWLAPIPVHERAFFSKQEHPTSSDMLEYETYRLKQIGGLWYYEFQS